MSFISDLVKVFSKNANESNSIAMAAYMKHKFTFFGIKSAHRKQLLKEVINRNKTELSESSRKIILELYKLPQREVHYCAMEIMAKYLKSKFILEDIRLIKKLILTHSHWDTVDFIAKHILGNFLLQFPNQKGEVITGFSNSNNMWLNRSAILFQLGYKNKTNSTILFRECKKHSKSEEFFIQKAIGWALREYAKTNPDDVKDFVNSNQLAPLSKREALKHFK